MVGKLRRGQVVVTNGPLLRPRVFGPGAPREGALPGHVFKADKGKTVELQIALNLSTRDPIDYLEVVQDGKVVHEVRLDQWAKAGGKLPPVKFDNERLVPRSGRHEQSQDLSLRQHRPVLRRDRLRAARQQEGGPVFRRLGRMSGPAASSSTIPSKKTKSLEHHRQARDFWQKKLAEANAE